jgi:hypothetical protein
MSKLEEALRKDANTMLADFQPGDPGKHVQTLIPTPEWKALKKYAEFSGCSLSLIVRIAIRQHLVFIDAGGVLNPPPE